MLGVQPCITSNNTIVIITKKGEKIFKLSNDWQTGMNESHKNNCTETIEWKTERGQNKKKVRESEGAIELAAAKKLLLSLDSGFK